MPASLKELLRDVRKMEHPKVYIRVMGKFSIEVDGNVHSELMTLSPKGLGLMELLIAEQGRLVPSHVLMEELWHRDTSGTDAEEKRKAKTRLKTLVCRTREYLNLLSPGLGECIVSMRGAYAWQMSTDVEVDLYDVLSHCAAITEATSFDVEQWNLAEELIRLYGTGLYLNGEWQSGPQKAFSLHEQYLKSVFCYLKSLERRGDYLRVYTVCTEALKKDPDNQDLLRIRRVSLVRLEEKQITIPEELSGDESSAQLRKPGKVREDIPEDTASLLRSLPVVAKVTSKNVTFTPEFKEFFAQEYEKGRTAWEILREEGVDPELLGLGRITSLCTSAGRVIRLKQTGKGISGRAPSRMDSLRMSRRIAELEDEIAYLNRKLEVLERKREIAESGDSVLHSAGGR